MSKLEPLWRERIDWVQAPACAEPGVSAASVYPGRS